MADLYLFNTGRRGNELAAAREAREAKRRADRERAIEALGAELARQFHAETRAIQMAQRERRMEARVAAHRARMELREFGLSDAQIEALERRHLGATPGPGAA